MPEKFIAGTMAMIGVATMAANCVRVMVEMSSPNAVVAKT
jgi:hypothetical protein